MGLTDRGKVGRLTKKIREQRGGSDVMGKDKERTLQIMSAVKELKWVVIDIITKTIKIRERRRHR